MPSAADTAFAKVAPALRPAAEAMRAAVLRAAPRLTEEVKWGYLCFSGRKPVLALAPHKMHINLQFSEGMIVDPDGRLLKGTGKAMRHFKFSTAEAAARKDLMALIAKAAALDTARSAA